MTWTVSIDVPVLRGVVSDLQDFVTEAGQHQSSVVSAAVRACASASPVSGLDEQIDAVSDAAADLEARIELAIVVNSSGGEPSFDSPLTYEIPAYSADTGELARQLLGEQLAELGDEIVDGGGEDWQVRLLGEQLEQWSDNDDVVTSMFESLGADGTIYLTTEMGIYVADGGDKEVAQKVVDELREGLENASKAWDDTDAEQFAKDMVDAAVNPDLDVYDRPGSTTTALSLLMYDGDYDGEFLTGAADAIAEFESGLDRPAHDRWYMASVRLNSMVFFPEDAVDWAFDPMVSVFDAMADRPHLALDWWSDADQEYWIRDRDWQHDGFRSISGVLDAATTTPYLISDPESQTAHDAAVLASSTVEFMADRDDIDDIAETITQDAANPASENFAHIMTTYMVGVDQRLQNPSAGDVSIGAGPIYSDAFNGHIANVPTFSTDGLEKFALIAMATDDGFAQVRTGLNDYRGAKLGTLADSIGLSDPPSDTDTEQLRAGIQQDAALEGFFVEQIGESRIADGAEKDARIEAWVDFGSGLIDAIPVPGASIGNQFVAGVVNLAVDTGKGSGYDAIKEALATHEEEAVTSADELARTTLEQQEMAIATLLDERGLTKDPESMLTGAQDGHVIGYDQFVELNDQDQNTALSEIFSSDLGVGDYFNRAEYEGAYLDEFEDIFKAARG